MNKQLGMVANGYYYGYDDYSYYYNDECTGDCVHAQSGYHFFCINPYVDLCGSGMVENIDCSEGCCCYESSIENSNTNPGCYNIETFTPMVTSQFHFYGEAETDMGFSMVFPPDYETSYQYNLPEQAIQGTLSICENISDMTLLYYKNFSTEITITNSTVETTGGSFTSGLGMYIVYINIAAIALIIIHSIITGRSKGKQGNNEGGDVEMNGI